MMTGFFALYDPEPIQKVCDAMNDYSERKGFKLNTKKTKTMVVGGTKQATGSKVLAKIDNEYLRVGGIIQIVRNLVR